MSVANLSTELLALLDGTRPGGPLGQRTKALALGTTLQNIITQVNANEAALGENDGLSIIINADAVAGTNEDPSLVLKGGDGGSEIAVATLKQDSSADLLYYTQGGGAAGTTRKTPNFNVGLPGETTADLDAQITFNSATSAGAAKVGSIIFQGQENNLKLAPASGGTIELSDKTIQTADVYQFQGSDFDLDPTGDFTLDMDATKKITITITTALANALRVMLGANEWLNFSTDSASIAFGNSTDNPVYAFLGSGAVSANGGFQTNALLERTAGSGITLSTGTEIIGVPLTLQTATAYNLADTALWTVPAGEVWLIHRVWHRTTTSWNGNGTAQIGVTADPNGFLDLANTSLVTTWDESGGVTGWPTGSHGLCDENLGVLLAKATTFERKEFYAVAGTTILWDVTTGTSNQGVGVAYLQYTRLV